MPQQDPRFAALLPQPRHLTLLGGETDAAEIVAQIDRFLPAQGYQLRIDDRIDIRHRDPAGRFYAEQTLAQLRTLFGAAIPRLQIDDAPDFPARGLMLDISRDKVPTMATLRRIIDEMAAMKLNQLQLYTEHTFAYSRHRAVWEQASPITAEEIRELDAYCRERFIELVPNQNSLGHMERWLKHPDYLPLAESPEGSMTPWNVWWEGPYSICPTDPRSIELIGGLYDELLPNFTSPLFNVGCDETFDIGQANTRSQAICKAVGSKRIYLDFLKQIHAHCARHGRRMMFWGDIIMESPELVPELPNDVIALEWGYEANHPFDEHCAHFKKAGRAFYVCPGTSSWLTLTGRTDNAMGNLRSAAENGLKHEAIGYLITDWGDWGHHQYWPVSYLPIAYGAALAWGVESARRLDLFAAADKHLFRDRAGKAARFFHDLGNVYTLGPSLRNGTVFGRILHESLEKPSPSLPAFTLAHLRAESEAAAALVETIAAFDMDRDDADLIAAECRDTIALVLHALRLSRYRLDDPAISPAGLADELTALLPGRRQLWFRRNREGGLNDSMRRLETRLDEYRRRAGVQ